MVPLSKIELNSESDEARKYSENSKSLCELLLKKKTEQKLKQDKNNDEWQIIQEVVESDFLTSPADIYPNQRVELQDTVISEETKGKFEELCDKYEDVFSKSNQDISKTTLIEMEIDTGHSLPVAQSLYTLPLKHYKWVRK